MNKYYISNILGGVISHKDYITIKENADVYSQKKEREGLLSIYLWRR